MSSRKAEKDCSSRKKRASLGSDLLASLATFGYVASRPRPGWEIVTGDWYS